MSKHISWKHFPFHPQLVPLIPRISPPIQSIPRKLLSPVNMHSMNVHTVHKPSRPLYPHPNVRPFVLPSAFRFRRARTMLFIAPRLLEAKQYPIPRCCYSIFLIKRLVRHVIYITLGNLCNTACIHCGPSCEVVATQYLKC